MIGPRITLKWFLIAAALIPMLIGTLGKQLYDDWQRQKYLERQTQVVDQLRTFGSDATLRDGHIVKADIRATTDASAAIQWLRECQRLEELRVIGPLSDREAMLLQGHDKLCVLGFFDSGGNLTNRSLKSLSQMARLNSLGVSDSLVTDDGLKHLAELKELSAVGLGNGLIQGQGLRHLSALPKLKVLSLRGEPLNDDQFAAIAACRELTDLDLSASKLKGPGLNHLRNIASLERLNLSETRLTSGEGFRSLDQVTDLELKGATFDPGVLQGVKGMSNLRRLNMLGAFISDAHLAELEGVPRLAHLNLMNTNVSDAGMVHVRQLKKLIRLDLRNTRVTADGAHSLARDMPALEIIYGDNSHIHGDPKLRFEMQFQPDE